MGLRVPALIAKKPQILNDKADHPHSRFPLLHERLDVLRIERSSFLVQVHPLRTGSKHAHLLVTGVKAGRPVVARGTGGS
eukprot:3770096-Pleurochrysis_carterae.AAC.1